MNTTPQTASADPIAAIVLAGGQSSRMGQDKALIPIAGVPMLQRVCQVALHCCPHVYVVTPWGDRYQSLLPPGCVLIPEIPLSNETEPHGPLVGFAQGLAQVQAEWILLLACDLPRLQTEVIQSWIAQLPAIDDSVMALLYRSPKAWDPLCGFYRRRCLATLNTYIAQGGRSFQGWLAGLTVQELTLSDDGMLFNCNTPQDLAKLRSLPE
jgi:molybdenum cofactor guanylyltransferase